MECMPNLAEQGAAALMLRGMELKANDDSGKKRGDKLKPATTGEGTVADQLFWPSTMTNITDHATTRSHLCAIAAAKRKFHPSQHWDSDGTATMIRWWPWPLFQYRHYSEQQPLQLSGDSEHVPLYQVHTIFASECDHGHRPCTKGAQCRCPYSFLHFL